MPDSQRVQYPTRAVDNRPQNFSLITTSTTANQTIGSRTVPDGKKFCIQAIIIEVYYTTLSTTAAYLGELSVRFGGSAIIGPFKASNTTSGAILGLKDLVIPKAAYHITVTDLIGMLDTVSTVVSKPGAPGVTKTTFTLTW